MFLSDVQSRQPEVDEVVKAMKRMAPQPAATDENRESGTPPKSLLSKQRSASRLKLTPQHGSPDGKSQSPRLPIAVPV